jgi:hypothetical protein
MKDGNLQVGVLGVFVAVALASLSAPEVMIKLL